MGLASSARYERYYVKDGVLLSYGPSLVDEMRLAADYVDRILKAEKPANLRVIAIAEFLFNRGPQLVDALLSRVPSYRGK
jgi:hypothetical protein